MKAVAYIRVSTEEQAREGVSLAAQRERITAYAALKGLTIVEFIEDAGVSAGKPLSRRHGGRRLLSMAGKEINHVLVYKLDRAFRNTRDCLNTMHDWHEAGVSLHLVDMGGSSLDTSSAMGKVFITMIASFAEFERDVMGERIKMALRHMRSKGLSTGGRKAKEISADTKAKVLGLRAEGKSIREIAQCVSGLSASGIHRLISRAA